MVYIGLLIAATGLTFVAKPIHALHVSTRSQGLAIVGLGLLLTGIGLTLPIAESRLENAETRLDEFFPVWQFSERHSIAIDAPPTVQKPTWNEVIPPARMQMIEREIAKFEKPLIRRASSCA